MSGKSVNGVEADALWRRYKESGSVEDRNKLACYYTYLISAKAARICKRLPNGARFDYDDLLQEGAIGLIDAIGKYDLSKGLKFTTFVDIRINGAMMDMARESDPIPRMVRSRAKRYNSALSSLIDSRELRDDVSIEEQIQRRLGVDDTTFHKIAMDSLVRNGSSLDDYISSEDEGTFKDNLCDNREGSPDSRMVTKDIVNYMVRGLSRDERTTMILYYCEGLTFDEIGKALGLSQSRVSQISGNALLRLRNRFGYDGNGDFGEMRFREAS